MINIKIKEFIVKLIFFFKQIIRGSGKVSLKFLLIGSLGIYLRRGKGIDQKQLIRKNNWDVLILLDACRYDYFKKIYRRFLYGDLIKANSPASGTAPWLRRMWDGKYSDVRIISSNPRINSKGIGILGYNAIEHFKKENIIDVWNTGWDNNLNTVPPEKVLEATRKLDSFSKKTLIWFMQPHGPWIGDPGIALSSTRPMEGNDEAIIPLIRKGKISLKQFQDMYLANLKLVLKYVKKVVQAIPKDKNIIVTSDHGELLGEYDSFLHFTYFTSPELREVPYLEIKRK
jgi:hypothetical protein